MKMNVDELVTIWKDVIVAISTAHTKEEIDKAEYKMDDMLQPILSAPVAQLREFHQLLTAELQRDPRVPFFIWSMFNVWTKGVLDQCAEKDGTKRLRRKLAGEIADMVDDEVKRDITGALVGALMWRDPAKLEEIKADISAGARVKVKGKESCLFLTTSIGRGAKKRENQVML